MTEKHGFRMKLLVYNPKGFEFSDRHVSKVKSTASVEVVVAKTGAEVSENIGDCDVLVCSNSNFRPEWLDNAPRLKWIHAMSAGVEKILPCLPDNILLANAKGVHGVNISEQVLGYMLAFERRFLRTFKAQADRKWIADEMRADAPTAPGELNGKTAAIFGMGKIGRRIAELCKCFGMNVIGVKQDVSEKPPFVDSLHSLDNFESVLGEADYVIIALPHTKQTHHLFSKTQFTAMKSPAFFINIGRGSIVNEPDLVDALKKGLIAGAGLDVFEAEPLPESSELWGMDNVIVTPHSAGSTPKYMDRFADIFCNNLKAFLNNKPLPNLVDREKGY